MHRLLVRGAPLAFLLSVVACSVSCSGEDAAAGSPDVGVGGDAAGDDGSVDGALFGDASGDAPSGDGSSDAAADALDAPAATCGVDALGSVIALFTDRAEAGGATITFEGCAKAVTASSGTTPGWYLKVASISGWFRASKTGFRTTLSSEIVPTSAPIGLELVGTAPPGFVDTKAHVLVSLVGTSGACTRNGNKLSLAGHPEAVVTYLDHTGANVGAATNVDGLAWITNVAPGGFAKPTLVPSVAGCTLDSQTGSGTAPLLAGTVASLKFVLRP